MPHLLNRFVQGQTGSIRAYPTETRLSRPHPWDRTATTMQKNPARQTARRFLHPARANVSRLSTLGEDLADSIEGDRPNPIRGLADRLTRRGQAPPLRIEGPHDPRGG